MVAIAQYIKEYGLAGGFVFDLSMDTLDFDSGDMTYELTTLLRQTLDGDDDTAPAHDGGRKSDDGSTSGNICLPDNGCNVCDACCASYLGDQDSCDGCVAAECAASNVCAADTATCTTCDACCKDYLSDQDTCDSCAADQC